MEAPTNVAPLAGSQLPTSRADAALKRARSLISNLSTDSRFESERQVFLEALAALSELGDSLTWLAGEMNRLRTAADQAGEKALELHNQINSPVLGDFLTGVRIEAAYQADQWARHDQRKSDPDWFWLVAHLVSKLLIAAQSGDIEQAKHHACSASAVLFNWHCQVRGLSLAEAAELAKGKGANDDEQSGQPQETDSGD